MQEAAAPILTDLRKKLRADCEFVSKHPTMLPQISDVYKMMLSGVEGGAWMLEKLEQAALVKDTVSKAEPTPGAPVRCSSGPFSLLHKDDRHRLARRCEGCPSASRRRSRTMRRLCGAKKAVMEEGSV